MGNYETYKYCIFSSGYFPGVKLFLADVSEPCISSIFKGWVYSLKMELIQGSETSANYNLTPGKYPEENIQYSNHGESLKSGTNILFYILNLWLRIYCSGLRGCDTREKEIVIWPCWCFHGRYYFYTLKFNLMFINERKRNANTYLISNFDSLEAAPSNLPP